MTIAEKFIKSNPEYVEKVLKYHPKWEEWTQTEYKEEEKDGE